MNIQFKNLLPHLIAVGLFLLIALIYCKPALEGKVLNAHDNQGWKGMAQQSIEAKEKYGKIPLWTNSLFSGMPGYQVAMENTHNISYLYVGKILTLGLPKPANFFFLACIAFYILALVMGAQPVIAIMGALAYAFSTYNAIIIGAGHDTKMLALGYAPLIVAGLLLLFQKRFLIGITLLSGGFSMQLSTSHIQIVYYTLLILAFITVGFLIESIRTKVLPAALKSIGIAILGGMLALGSNAVITLMNWDYSKASMRGGISEMKIKNDQNTTEGGLDKDYAFKYSVGLSETFTLLVPGLYGGSNGGKEYKSSQFADKLTEIGYPEEQALQYANGVSYWGNQQPTSGPVYFGAVMILLVILSFFTTRGWMKWSLIAAGAFGIILAWGKNLEAVNYFLFDYLPLYKKFRAPSMGLVIPQLCFMMLATMGLQHLFFESKEDGQIQRALKKTALTMIAVLALITLLYFNFDYISPNDQGIRENMSNAMVQQISGGKQPDADLQQKANAFGKEFTTAIQSDRRSLLGNDLMRSVIFILLGFAIIVGVVRQKITAFIGSILMVAISFADLVAVDSRYLNEDNYVEAGDFENAFDLSEADKQIKQDSGYFRVLNQTGDPFNESLTSYHHNSIGGYHPAKLQIYQDLIEHQISKNNIQVLNMLNTKYVIVNDPQTNQPAAQLNPEALGPCWLVKGIRFVQDGRAEMAALDNTPLKDTAIVQMKFKDRIAATPVADSTASLQFVFNKNDSIRYMSQSSAPQFAVFSEIYYDRGWNAYIDDEPAPVIKTNYALRGLMLPAGKHNIVFRFEPAAYRIGNMISLIATLILYAITLFAAYWYWNKNRKHA